MGKLIKLEEVVVDREADILSFAEDYHKRLCGCDRDDRVPYIERITELYDEYGPEYFEGDFDKDAA